MNQHFVCPRAVGGNYPQLPTRYADTLSFYFLPSPPNCFFPLSFRQRIRANESGVAGGTQPATGAPPAGARRRSPGPRSPPVRSGPSSSCLRGCAAHRVTPVPRPCGPAVAAGCCPALGLTCAHGGPQRRRPPHRHGGLGGGGVAGGYGRPPGGGGGRPPGGATTLELVSATPTSLDCHPPRRYPAWPHPRRR